MENPNQIDESGYKADFMISENFIRFSSELLRLSLLAIGGFGTLVLVKVRNETQLDILANPVFFILAMSCFAASCVASLFHRYCATDAMSWYISWIRAENKGDGAIAGTEKKGLHRILRYSRISLITCEASFALAVVFFFVAIMRLVASIDSCGC